MFGLFPLFFFFFSKKSIGSMYNTLKQFKKSKTKLNSKFAESTRPYSKKNSEISKGYKPAVRRRMDFLPILYFIFVVNSNSIQWHVSVCAAIFYVWGLFSISWQCSRWRFLQSWQFIQYISVIRNFFDLIC